jgi:hypothetical protein
LRPVGMNCALSKPPATAGEEFNHGMVLRIFPRAKDINASYTGCQALMVEYEGRWTTITLSESGRVRSLPRTFCHVVTTMDRLFMVTRASVRCHSC